MSVALEINMINYKELSDKELYQKLKEIGKIGLLAVKLPKGTGVSRCRPGKDYDKVSDFSYKPNHLNSTFQRASSPAQNMFYGTFNGCDIQSTRYVTAFECSELLSDKNRGGEEFLSYGLWRNTQPLNLAVIVKSSCLPSGNEIIAQFQQMLNDSLACASEEDREYFRDFNNLLADLFSTPSDDSGIYRLTGSFSQIIVEHGYDGIAFPSVPTLGEFGMNVALKPECVDLKMELMAVLECKVCKEKDIAEIKVIRHGEVIDKTIYWK